VRAEAGAEDEVFAVDQVDEAGVAAGELLDEPDDGVEGVCEAELSHHEAADALIDGELVLEPVKPVFQFSGTGHNAIIPSRQGISVRTAEIAFRPARPLP
jgi:hypothetical protein